jgi:type I restriction enzyme, S subunit
MRDGWTRTTLGELMTLEYGKGLPESRREEGPFPVFGSAGIVGAHIEPLVTPGPVIVVGRKGTAGAVHWSDTPCWPIDTTSYAVPGPQFVARYAWLLLQAADLPSLCAQTGVPGLNRDRAYEVEVLVPPFPEQRRILDLVAAVDEAAGAASQLAQAAALAAGAVIDRAIEAAGSRTRLGDLSVVKGGKRLPKGTAWASHSNNHPYIRVVDMKDGRIRDDALVYVPDEVWPVIKRYVVAAWDVVISIVGTIGEVALVPPSLSGANLTENAALIRTHATLDPGFLAAYLHTPQGRSEVSRLTVGTTQPKLALFRIEDIGVPVLSLDRQRACVALHDVLREVARAADTEAANLRPLRGTLLTELVSGEHEIPEPYDRLLVPAT